MHCNFVQSKLGNFNVDPYIVYQARPFLPPCALFECAQKGEGERGSSSIHEMHVGIDQSDCYAHFASWLTPRPRTTWPLRNLTYTYVALQCLDRWRCVRNEVMPSQLCSLDAYTTVFVSFHLDIPQSN